MTSELWASLGPGAIGIGIGVSTMLTVHKMWVAPLINGSLKVQKEQVKALERLHACIEQSNREHEVIINELREIRREVNE